MKTFMKKWKWKILILVYLCFIYGNSLTPAAISSKESGYFLAKIQDFLAGAGMDAWWLTEHLVRKAAHFTEYAGLGFLLAMNTGAGIAPVFCLLKGNVTAVLFMPFVDETIQLFVEGRSGQISDVWLDMAGIVTGIMVTAGFMKMTGALKKLAEKLQRERAAETGAGIMNYKVVMAYDGSRYNGWQKQGNTDKTIQGKLEQILFKMTGEEIEVHGSGRTDAGVHARGQVANFHIDWKKLEVQEKRELEKMPETRLDRAVKGKNVAERKRRIRSWNISMSICRRILRFYPVKWLRSVSTAAFQQ